MAETSTSDEVSYISSSPKSDISDVSLVNELISYFNGLSNSKYHLVTPDDANAARGKSADITETVEDRSIKTAKSMESMFRVKNRRNGELNLSQNNLTTLANEPTGVNHETFNLRVEENNIGVEEDTNEVNEKKDVKQNDDDSITDPDKESLKPDSFKLAKKYLPSDLFNTLNGLFDKKRSPSVQSQVDKQSSQSHIESLHRELKPADCQSRFHPETLELLFREELENDQVVPLSNIALKKSEGHYTDSFNVIKVPEAIITEDTSKTISKRQAFKNMFNTWTWRKPKVLSDSAELENRIFSPDTHRPNNLDVPSIYQVEDELEDQPEEESEPTGRKASISSLFGPLEPVNRSGSNETELAAKMSQCEGIDNSLKVPAPIIKQSRIRRGLRKIKAKSPTLHVRFLSPLHSPLHS